MFQKIKIENFKSIKGKVTLDDVNDIVIFEGNSRQGKTNFLKAIRWAIVGSSDSEMINHDADETRVALTSDSGSVIERSLLRDAKSSRLTITVHEDQVAEPAKFLKTFYSAYCFDPIEFCFLSGKDQAAVIRNTLSSRATITAEEAKKCGFELDTKISAVEQLNTYYDKYYSERKILSAKVDQFKKTSRSISLDRTPTQEELDVLKTEISELTERVNHFTKEQAIAETSKRNIDTEKKLKADLEKLKKEVEGIKPDTSIEDLKKKLEKIKKDFNASSEKESNLRGQVKQLEKTLSTLGEKKFPICPLSNKINCSTDISDVKSSMEEELATNRTELKSLHAANLKLSESKDELEKKIENFENYDSKTCEIERIQATLDTLSGSNSEDFNEDDLINSKDELATKQQEYANKMTYMNLLNDSDIEAITTKRDKYDAYVKNISFYKDVELPKRMELGIPGLELRDTGLYFKDTNLKEESTFMQLRLAVSIMKSLYPKNNILTLDRIESIDSENLKKFIAGLVKEGSRQVFATYVGRVPDDIRDMEEVTVLTIENGKIVGAC